MKRTEHAFLSRRSLLRIGLCVAVVGHASLASAKFPYSAAGNQTTFTATPVTASNVGNFTFGFASDGTPIVRTNPNITIPGGSSVPVNVSAPITKPSMGRALANFLGKLALPITVGMATFDLLKDLDILPFQQNGKNAFQKLAPGNYPSSGFEYLVEFLGNDRSWTGSPQAACYNALNRHVEIDGHARTATWTEVSCTLSYVNPSTGPSNTIPISKRASSACPAGSWWTPAGCKLVPSYEQVTMTDLENMIASKSGWPSKRTHEALEQAIKSGEQVQTETPTVTGPASKTGTTTSTDSTGKTVVSNNTTNFSYTDNRVTYNTTTVTNTTNPDGTTVTGTTTTATPEAQDPDEACKANPNRVGCSELDTPEGDIPRETKTLAYEELNLFGSGSCPADRSQVIAGKQLVIVPWSEYCVWLGGPFRGVLIICASMIALFIVTQGLRE